MKSVYLNTARSHGQAVYVIWVCKALYTYGVVHKVLFYLHCLKWCVYHICVWTMFCFVCGNQDFFTCAACMWMLVCILHTCITGHICLSYLYSHFLIFRDGIVSLDQQVFIESLLRTGCVCVCNICRVYQHLCA